MQIDLRDNAPEDNTIEYVFGKAGDSLIYDKEDSQVFYIEDINETAVSLGIGDIDLLIEALQKLKEKVDE